MLEQSKYADTATTICSSNNASEKSVKVSKYFELSPDKKKVYATVPRKIKVISHNKLGGKKINCSSNQESHHHNHRPRFLLKTFVNKKRLKKKEDEKEVLGLFTKIARQRLRGEDPYHHHYQKKYARHNSSSNLCVDNHNKSSTTTTEADKGKQEEEEMSWRDFQQELKNKHIFTGAGLRQFVPEVVERSNINFIEEVYCDDDSLLEDDSSINSFHQRDDFIDLELDHGFCNRSQEELSMRCLNNGTSRARLIDDFLEEMDNEEEAPPTGGGICEQSIYTYFVFVASAVLLLSYSSFNM